MLFAPTVVNRDPRGDHLLNQLLTMPLARFLARPEPYIAFEAKPVAWLNLSQREYASALVMVSTSAITILRVSPHPHSPSYPSTSSHPSVPFNPLPKAKAEQTHQPASTR